MQNHLNNSFVNEFFEKSFHESSILGNLLTLNYFSPAQLNFSCQGASFQYPKNVPDLEVLDSKNSSISRSEEFMKPNSFWNSNRSIWDINYGLRQSGRKILNVMKTVFYLLSGNYFHSLKIFREFTFVFLSSPANFVLSL